MFCILSKGNKHIIIVNIEVAPTWVVIKYDIKKVLVSPGNIEFVLLKKRHQHFLPLQWKSCHIVLEVGNTLVSFYIKKYHKSGIVVDKSFNKQFTSIQRKLFGKHLSM